MAGSSRTPPFFERREARALKKMPRDCSSQTGTSIVSERRHNGVCGQRTVPYRRRSASFNAKCRAMRDNFKRRTIWLEKSTAEHGVGGTPAAGLGAAVPRGKVLLLGRWPIAQRSPCCAQAQGVH